MSELAVNDSDNQQIVEDYGIAENDTDSLGEDEDQETASDLDDEHNQSDVTTSVERAIVLPAATMLLVKEDDDDFRPAKKRKFQESNSSTEVDEVANNEFDIMEFLHINL